MIRGKNGFWLLTAIFGIMVMVVVLNSDNYGMMIVRETDGTMGQMMKRDHAAGSSLGDLFNTAWAHQAQPMGGHHQLPPFIKSLDLSSSAVILTIFPLLVGATVVLIILWT